MKIIDKKRKETKGRDRRVIGGVILFGMICVAGWFWSHPTSYQYNDRWVLGKNMQQIQARYGTFDEIDGGGLKAGYYLYEDEQLVMPSHLPVYYWIYFGEDGKAEKMTKGGPIGG